MLGDTATLLLGADATAPHLRDAVEHSPPRVLHLATHGLMGSADRPMLASLALSTPKEPSLNDTGFLTLEDILSHWGGSLRGNELVVLSACDTAQGVKQGDTTMALPLGLFVCGTETVIASLWKVDDQATALLMARFYANWLGKSQSARDIDGMKYEPGKPMPKLAALREAKSWLRSLTTADRERLTSAKPEQIAETVSRGGVEPLRGSASSLTSADHPYDHPYYWAAFVLMGSPE
jgi:CHAT domain-containing protein